MKSLKIFLLASLASASFTALADTTTMEQAQDLNPNAQNTAQITAPITTNTATQHAISKGPTMKDCDAMKYHCQITSMSQEKHDACLAKAEKCKDQATGLSIETQQQPQQPAASQPAATTTTKPTAY